MLKQVSALYLLVGVVLLAGAVCVCGQEAGVIGGGAPDAGLAEILGAMRPSGNHYVNSVEGLKAGSLPPPGLYWRMYNVFYMADHLADESGGRVPLGFDLDVYAMANRLLWVSEKTLLGGNYFASVVIPLVNTDVELTVPGPPGQSMVIGSSDFGLGDIDVDFFNLVWRGDQYEAGLGVGVFVPVGEYTLGDMASPGKDMWTGMLTLAGTYYLDKDRTWAASVLARYEKHSEQGDRDVTFGDDCHFEWGLSKTLAKIIDIGACGYCHWQVTEDGGSAVTWDKGVRDKAFAIGPEISVFVPPPVLLSVSVRTLWEFEVEDRPEGNATCLTLTKIF